MLFHHESGSGYSVCGGSEGPTVTAPYGAASSDPTSKNYRVIQTAVVFTENCVRASLSRFSHRDETDEKRALNCRKTQRHE